MDFCSRDYHHYSLSSTTKWELHKRHNRSRYLHGVCYNTSLSTFSGVRCARWWSATASFALQWYTCTTHTHTHRYFCAKRAIAGNQPSSPFHHTMLWHTGQGDGPPGGLTGWWCCLPSLECSFHMIFTLGSWLHLELHSHQGWPTAQSSSRLC